MAQAPAITPVFHFPYNHTNAVISLISLDITPFSLDNLDVASLSRCVTLHSPPLVLQLPLPIIMAQSLNNFARNIKSKKALQLWNTNNSQYF